MSTGHVEIVFSWNRVDKKITFSPHVLTCSPYLLRPPFPHLFPFSPRTSGGLTRARLDTPSYNGLWARVTRFLGRSDDDRGPGTFFQTSVVLNCVLVLVLMGVVAFRGASVTPSNAKTGETNTHRHTTNTHVETNLGLVAADEPRCSEVRIARFPDPNTV